MVLSLVLRSQHRVCLVLQINWYQMKLCQPTGHERNEWGTLVCIQDVAERNPQRANQRRNTSIWMGQNHRVNLSRGGVSEKVSLSVDKESFYDQLNNLPPCPVPNCMAPTLLLVSWEEMKGIRNHHKVLTISNLNTQWLLALMTDWKTKKIWENIIVKMDSRNWTWLNCCIEKRGDELPLVRGVLRLNVDDQVFESCSTTGSIISISRLSDSANKLIFKSSKWQITSSQIKSCLARLRDTQNRCGKYDSLQPKECRCTKPAEGTPTPKPAPNEYSVAQIGVDTSENELWIKLKKGRWSRPASAGYRPAFRRRCAVWRLSS